MRMLRQSYRQEITRHMSFRQKFTQRGVVGTQFGFLKVIA